MRDPLVSCEMINFETYGVHCLFSLPIFFGTLGSALLMLAEARWRSAGTIRFVVEGLVQVV